MTLFSSHVNALRRGFQSGKMLPIEVRKEQLRNLIRLVNENKDVICNAVFNDLRKCASEVYCYEVLFVLNEADDAIRHLDSWAKPDYVSKSLLQALDSPYIIKQPLGVVLIISPWNYPVQLLLTPLIGALAAGNCVLLKPSEHSSATSNIFELLFKRYFDPEIVCVVNGGIKETEELLKERFDHILFTGSTSVAKHILHAAAEHLTPVTLELGGKCPTIVDTTCDVALAARRIIWGKLIASGQTCLAPDYVFCHRSIKADFINAIKATIFDLYGDDAQRSPDYCRIINTQNFNRIMKIIQSGNVVFGGQNDVNDLYIAPTILDEVQENDFVMQEEIFGPVLPILVYDDMLKVIEFINSKERPLALYLFSTDKPLIKEILAKTVSGGVTINDVVMHCALNTLPFGGVGGSGMGRYHGKYSFDCFTHEKAVLDRPLFGEFILWMRYPPYNKYKLRWAAALMTRRSVIIDCLMKTCLPIALCTFVLAAFFKFYAM